MRDFGCRVHSFFGKNLLGRPKFIGRDYVCWGLLASPFQFNQSLGSQATYANTLAGKEIYISNYDQPETRKYQELLVKTINEITPCEFKEVNGKKYIAFKLMETYDQSLVLLNFVRNLWHSPPVAGAKIPYHKMFFETLEKADHKDPLEKLTYANKEACPDNLMYGAIGHSNVYNKGMLKLKTKAQLLQFKGNSTQVFLTS